LARAATSDSKVFFFSSGKRFDCGLFPWTNHIRYHLRHRSVQRTARAPREAPLTSNTVAGFLRAGQRQRKQRRSPIRRGGSRGGIQQLQLVRELWPIANRHSPHTECLWLYRSALAISSFFQRLSLQRAAVLCLRGR